MAESRRMSKSGLFTHFAERFGIKRAEAGKFFDELQQLTEQELLRCGEFVLPGVAKLVVQQREKRMGRNPATGAKVEDPGQAGGQGADPEARHGPYHYWTRKARGKTVGLKLTEEELGLYREWIENNRELETAREGNAPHLFACACPHHR